MFVVLRPAMVALVAPVAPPQALNPPMAQPRPVGAAPRSRTDQLWSSGSLGKFLAETVSHSEPLITGVDGKIHLGMAVLTTTLRDFLKNCPVNDFWDLTIG